LREHIVEALRAQISAQKKENAALKQELIDMKKEKAEQLATMKQGFFPPPSKRERNEADGEIIRYNEETKRIKKESPEESNNYRESGAETPTKKGLQGTF
jgi:hypothetical protein